MAADVPRRQPALRSRRELLGPTGLAAAGAALLLPGCGGGDEEAIEPEVPNPERDVAVLSPVLEQERASLVAYDEVVRRLDGDLRSLARAFREDERRHGARVRRAIQELGGSPLRPRPPRSYAAGFPALRSRDDALRFAIDVEETAITSYLEAMGKLSTAALRAEAAAIVTVEAEQVAVLRLELGVAPLPAPFVGGEPPPI